MVRSRLRKNELVKLEVAGVWVCFRALRINLAGLAAQSLKNILLVLDKALVELGANGANDNF